MSHVVHHTQSDLLIAFTGNPLDRAEDRRGDAQWLEAARRDGDFLLCDGARIAAGEAGLKKVRPAIAWLDYGAAQPYLTAGADCIFLGLDNTGRAKFALGLRERAQGVPHAFIDGRSFAMQWAEPEHDKGQTGIAAQALSITSWHQRHRFCARCGNETESRRGGYQRFCKTCDTEHFPRTDPVAIMLVTDGDYCLLGRQPRFPAGSYSALAGFVEAGESLEAAVRREVHEEAGIHVGAVQYVASQPWPFPSNLMLGCLAEAISKEIRIDEDELEDARWFSRSEVEDAMRGNSSILYPPPKIAIAHHLIARWLD